ncbi:MAG: DegQ family serine endoprotease [Anderseniella sp.]
MTGRARTKVAAHDANVAMQMMARVTLFAFLVLAIWALGVQAARAEGPAPVADLAEQLSPAVVNISTSQKVGGPDGVPVPNVPEGTPFREFFEEFFKKQEEQGQTPRNRPNRRNANSLGSGFVIDAKGTVITNNHVIDGADEIEVIFNDGRRLKAELIGKDAKTDIAVLKVKSDTPLPFVEFGDSSTLRVGDWVMAIGNPFGLGGTVTLGIVSAMNRNINAGPYDDFIQTDASINRGNSGGPLFSMDGKVVGVNTAIISPSGGSIGIGFSVPSATARNVINQLIEFGETRRGWLGVRIQNVTEDLAESLGLDKAHGALVADVTKTSPAEKAGVKAGDVVVTLDGKEMKDSRQLSRAVGQLAPDTTVVVGVLRKGKPMDIEVTLGRLETGEKLVQAADRKNAEAAGAADVEILGLKVDELSDELRTKFKVPEKVQGVIVTEVSADGAAADKQLRPGDVIAEVGDVKATSPAELTKAVDEAVKAGDNSILMLVLRAQRNFDPHFIALRLKKK